MGTQLNNGESGAIQLCSLFESQQHHNLLCYFTDQPIHMIIDSVANELANLLAAEVA